MLVGAISITAHLYFKQCREIILKNYSSFYSSIILFILSIGVKCVGASSSESFFLTLSFPSLSGFMFLCFSSTLWDDFDTKGNVTLYATFTFSHI